jgi:hypothetical protein
MNEQIRLLAEESGIQLFLDRQFGWSVLAGTDRNLARFAELIVRECADVAGCNGHVSGFALGDLIREHFGVEE